MRALVVTLVAGALLAASVATAAAPQRTARVKPSASVLFTPAVVVVGKHFKAKERVTVSFSGSVSAVRKLRATSTGAFRVNFGAIALSDCSGFTLKVVGTMGSRCSMAHPPKPC